MGKVGLIRTTMAIWETTMWVDRVLHLVLSSPHTVGIRHTTIYSIRNSIVPMLLEVLAISMDLEVDLVQLEQVEVRVRELLLE